MNATTLLQWQYMIYLLPLGISATLLLLSSLRFGHRGAHGVSAHGHAVVGAHAGHRSMAAAGHPGTGTAGNHGIGTAAHHGVDSSAHRHGGHTNHGAHTGVLPRVHARMGKVEVSRHGPNRENLTLTTHFLLQITGADRAPLAMILELFFLIWGVCGYLADQYTLHTANPTLAQMLPSLGIAFGGGIIGARLGAEVIARVMPPDESHDVSHDDLFGMTGKVAFTVSATSGRIHIFDSNGTLHDETCRIAPGHETIAKGRTALVVDMDQQGRLLVEEIPDIRLET